MTNHPIFQKWKHLENVPCGDCTKCCHNDLIRIMPYDDITLYMVRKHPRMPGQYCLAHKPNGDCYYLTEKGCGIHSIRPAQCRTFDCRRMYLAYPKRKQADQLDAEDKLRIEVWKQGKKMLRNHGEPPPMEL